MDHRILPDLFVLLEAVQSGSLTKAARNLHTVQSNVTARIRVLEQAVGVRLLTRNSRGVTATAAGETAVAIAVRAAALVDELERIFGANRRPVQQKLRLGAIETVAAIQLPALVGAFQKAHPDLDVTVQADSSARLVRRVKNGEIDVAFVSHPSQIAGMRESVAFRDQLVAVAPLNFGSLQSLLSPGTPTMKVLKVLVQRLDCSYTKRLTGLLDKRGRRYRLLDLGTLEGVLKFVELGAGVAAMPLGFVRALNPSRTRRFTILKLPRNISKLELFMATQVESKSSAVTNRFVEFVNAQFHGE